MDGSALALGGPRQRALLAMLLLEANRPVSRDRLIDGLWGAQSPPTAQRSLETYISRLRALLGADRIVKRAPGYLARIEPRRVGSRPFRGSGRAITGGIASR